MFLIVLALGCGMPSIAMFMRCGFDAEGSPEDLIDAPRIGSRRSRQNFGRRRNVSSGDCGNEADARHDLLKQELDGIIADAEARSWKVAAICIAVAIGFLALIGMIGAGGYAGYAMAPLAVGVGAGCHAYRKQSIDEAKLAFMKKHRRAGRAGRFT